MRYTLTDEGDLVFYRERTLTGLGLDAVKHKVTFYQGDACNLKPLFTGYDLILAANLIDRLYDPAKLLTTIHARLNLGGLFADRLAIYLAGGAYQAGSMDRRVQAGWRKLWHA